MEFHEKLQKLRTDAGLTQEQLAAQLYVSRAAVSKWESGRGYPSIDSLKMIAARFSVTVDALIDGGEMVTLAEQGIANARRRYAALLCGVLDCLAALLFLLPVFGNGQASAPAVALPALCGGAPWLKIAFFVAVALTAANGLFTAVVSRLDRQTLLTRAVIAGAALLSIGTALFIVTRQPYAGVYFFSLLLIKGLLLIKRG